MRRRLGPDDQGAFPVLEAILVAILILTTILFFTSLQRPTTATDEGGIDLGRLASDTLAILQTKEFTKVGCMEGLTLEQWVGAALNSTNPSNGAASSCVADEVEAFLTEVLPPGSQFLVRLDNGVGPLVLVPYGSDDTPRAARAAETYITPLWLAASNRTNSQSVYPGQELGAADTNATAFKGGGVLCVKSPTGVSTGPGGVSWATFWKANATHVPSEVPFGAWRGYAAADCSGAVAHYLFVGLSDGTKTDYPVYGLQLVVWFGA